MSRYWLLIVDVFSGFVARGVRPVVVALSCLCGQHQLVAEPDRGSSDELPGACDPDEEADDYEDGDSPRRSDVAGV